MEDIRKLADSDTANVVFHAKKDTIKLSLVDDVTARRLAAKAGGLPV